MSRAPTLGGAVGTWGPDDVFLGRKNNLWPVPTLGTVAGLYHFDSDLTAASGGPTLVASGTTPPASSAGSAKFGGAGLLCSGTGVAVTATNAAFKFGNTDFCVEFWVKTPTAGGNANKAMLAISTTGNYDVGMIWVNGQYLGWYGPNSYFNTNYTYWDTDWHHLALVRQAGVIKMYFDGAQLNATANDSTNYSANARLSVGSCGDGSYAGAQWIDEVRVTTGNCVYTENFTPSTIAFTDPPESDASWSSVSSLLLLDGANNSTTFTDSKLGATITATGSPIISTTQSKFGGSSLYLNGSSYITIPNTSGNHTFAGDFTIEFWMYSAASSGYWLAGINTTGANDAGRFGLLTRGSEDKMHFEYYLAGNNSVYPSTIAVNNSTWHHIALVRSGTTLYLWIDGAQAMSTTLSHTFGDNAKNINIGYSPFDTSYFTGYIDCLRVTKGVARYTSTFTPRTSAFPAQ
jgi:hypothetical protein